MIYTDFYFLNREHSCPACGSLNIKFSFKSTKAAWSIPGFTLDRCLACESYFVNPRPSPDSLSLFYQTVYERFPDYTNKSLSYYTNDNRRKKMIDEFLAPLIKYKDSGRLFDFGAGAGWFMKIAEDHGFQVSGLDYLEKNVMAGREQLALKRLKIGTESDLPDTPSYDVFSALSTIEHLINPSLLIKKAWHLLHDDGVLMLVFPTSDSFMFKRFMDASYFIMAPYHLTHFSLNGIEKLLTDNNFRLLAFEQVKTSWMWTSSLVKTLNLNSLYQEWRKDPKFVDFDVAVDELFDELTFKAGLSSVRIVFAEKVANESF